MLWCSKEPSHRDGSLEFPQHMFWLRSKKNKFQLHTLIWGPALSLSHSSFLSLSLQGVLTWLMMTELFLTGALINSINQQHVLSKSFMSYHKIAATNVKHSGKYSAPWLGIDPGSPRYKNNALTRSQGVDSLTQLSEIDYIQEAMRHLLWVDICGESAFQ